VSVETLRTNAGKLSKERLRLWLRILKVSRHIETELRERLRVRFGSTLPRFDVLAALYRHKPGLKMSRLSGVLKVSNGNVTGIVDRLEEDGLVIRIPVEGDRRAMIVRLSDKGSNHFELLAAEHQKWVNDLLGSVDEIEAGELQSLLGLIASKLDPVSEEVA